MMLTKSPYRSLFVVIIIGLLVGSLLLLGLYPNIGTILGGVALFLIGMEYMEQGFKAFSGTLLERVLENFTNTTPKAITTGFFTTAIVQSSSLISIIVISFLSAELITLTSAIGVIIGSNVGTTTTAWLISLFGLKIKISIYAMPMLIVGIFAPMLLKQSSWRGIASIFVGLGIIFLGIGYLKEGFETLKDGIDLAQYALSGYRGIFIYLLVGMVATVVVQSSSATMAIIITALAAGQIDYANALALSIGANVGTTVTALIASIGSNENGKRLAVAHFVFNFTTGILAVAFIYQLADLVDYLSVIIGIGEHNYALKLALFHTIFNIVGVVVIYPFIGALVGFLDGLFVSKKPSKGKPKYLDDSMLAVPSSALFGIIMETKHLYENAFDIIVRALDIKKKNLLSSMELDDLVQDLYRSGSISVDDFYNLWIKDIYGDIIDFSTRAQADMPPEYIEELYRLKLANRDIVESVKETKHLQKNLLKYGSSRNEHIKEQYSNIRRSLAKLLRAIDLIANTDQEDLIALQLSKAKIDIQRYDIIKNGTLDGLIRKGLITNQMATSLMNDSHYAYKISSNLIAMAEILFIDIDSDLRRLHDEIGMSDEEIASMVHKDTAP